MSAENKARILVLDDDLHVMRTLLMLLEKQGGFEMHAVNHPEAAYEHLQTSPRLPDLILADMNLGAMSGLEFLAGLQLDPHWTRIPVILITGDEENGIEEKALAMGAVDFVRKPIPSGVLVKRIRNQLRIKHLQAQINNTRDVANNARVNLGAIQDHWQAFQIRHGANPEILPPLVIEEMDALVQSLGEDLRRIANP